MSILKTFKPENIDYSEVDKIKEYDKAVELEIKKTLKHKQQSQMADMRDSDNYLVITFCNEKDKLKLLEFINKRNIEVEGETFVDGYEFAASMGINIEVSASLPMPHFEKERSKKIKIKNTKLIL